MPTRRLVALCRGATAATTALALIACSSTATATPTPSASAPAAAPATPAPTLPPSPSPDPTPRFTNRPDPELEALLPDTVAGNRLTVAATDDFALTPGDVGMVYGDIGLRFTSLVLAYVEQPRLTLYALRVAPPAVSTADLEPHLATAGRYVGIAGLDPEPWQLSTVGGNEVWTRAGDRANPPGTVLYTWASGDAVFLLVGSDDTLNRALVEALPGAPANGAAAPPGSVAPGHSPTGGG